MASSTLVSSGGLPRLRLAAKLPSLYPRFPPLLPSTAAPARSAAGSFVSVGPQTSVRNWSTLDKWEVHSKEDFENRSRIDGYNSYGLLINGMHFLGSVLVFKDLVMRWNVPEFKDLQPEHLALVKAISPPVDIIVFGTGETILEIPERIKSFCRAHNIRFEAQQTKNAISVYEYLCLEGRVPAGAFYPEVNPNTAAVK